MPARKFCKMKLRDILRRQSVRDFFVYAFFKVIPLDLKISVIAFPFISDITLVALRRILQYNLTNLRYNKATVQEEIS